MIIHDVRQRSEEWDMLRLGIPTASEVHRILTPGGKLSAQAGAYMDFLLTSWACGHPIDDTDDDAFRSTWMDRGEHLEPKAREAYEFETDSDVTLAGFVTIDNGLVGCSPDGLVGKDGGLEIKIPKPSIHTGYLRTRHFEQRHFPQIQMCMLICERSWWDIISYCPGHPIKDLLIIRSYRDDKYIAQLAGALNLFLEDLLKARDALWKSSPQLQERFGVYPSVTVPKELSAAKEQSGEANTQERVSTLLRSTKRARGGERVHTSAPDGGL